MISTMFLSIAMSTMMVPPGHFQENHAHPAHYGRPTIRRFERFQVDGFRETNYTNYVRELETLWQEYRDNGSTPDAFRIYKIKANQARTRYLYNDPYYEAIVPLKP